MAEKITIGMLHGLISAADDIIELTSGINTADTIMKLKHIIESPPVAATLQSRARMLDGLIKRLKSAEIGGG